MALTVRARKRLPGFDLDVGWSVGDGFTVLFGYSGAGKSLTLSMLLGTMRPDEGRIVLDGETLVDTLARVWVPPQRRRIGYVSQSAELFPHMSVRRNIAYALKGLSRAESRSRTHEVLSQLGIEHLAEKPPHALSGGQRQRCALARALALRPRALVLDEPFSALDLPGRVEMRKVVREVARSTGTQVVMVTHDIIEAATLADTLVVYSGAGAIQVGTPAELFADPATPEIRRLVHVMELPAGLLGSGQPPGARAPGKVIRLPREDGVA